MVIIIIIYHYFLHQCLGQNSWWGARLLISLIEFQSRNILRLCGLFEIIILPFTVLLVFTYVSYYVLCITYHICFLNLNFLKLICKNNILQGPC